jgi:signal transduction histidine kinase
MGIMSKLLNKPFKTFTVYALVILAGSIPVYYWVVDAIWLEELDEHNQIISTRIEEGVSKIDMQGTELSKTLKAWNSIQPGTSLVPADQSAVRTAKMYTVIKYNPFAREVDRFRGLSTYIQIHGKPYKLTIETNVEEVDETLLAIALVTFTFFILLVLGFVILNKRISRNIWKPFRDTLEKLKAFDLNKDRMIGFERTDIEEFEELNLALVQLIQKNMAAFYQQKTFIENASHELQTPLAVLKSKIDLLLQTESMTEEQSEIITAISHNLSRVSRINKNLLLLAKIENNQFPEHEKVAVGELLHEVAELLADYRIDKGMDLQMHIDPQIISCNRTLLEVLVSNLLVNAILHGNYMDLITIRLSDSVLSFSNPADSALHETSLFRRFEISSSETTSSGLGLAIAKEICDSYGWQLSYTYIDHLHVFSVKF